MVTPRRDHPARWSKVSRYRIDLSPVARNTHAAAGERKKKQGNFRKETREIDSRSGFERARDFTTLSESCVEKSRPRGETPRQTRGRKNWKSGNSPGEIAKSKWASLKLS